MDAPSLAAPGVSYPTAEKKKAASWSLSNGAIILQRNIARARSSRFGGIFDASDGLVAAEHFHDLEDAGRGEGAGQRRAQRLGDGAELDTLCGDEISQLRFE